MSAAEWVRAGAVGALLCPLLLGAASSLGTRAGLPWAAPSVSAADGTAAIRARPGAWLLRQTLLLLGTAALIPAGPALRLAIGAGAFTDAAARAWTAGLAFALLNDVLLLAVLARAARQNGAANARRMLDGAIRGTQLVGDLLLIAAGAGLFSLAILRSDALPAWLGWVGIAAAVPAGLIHRPAALLRLRRVTAIGRAGFILFIAWLAAAGIGLLRHAGSAV